MKHIKKRFITALSLLLLSSTVFANVQADSNAVSKDIEINKVLKYNTSSANIPMFEMSTYYQFVSDNSSTTRNVLGSKINYKNQDTYRLNKVYTAYMHGYHDHNFYGGNRVSVATTWNPQLNKFVLPEQITSVHGDLIDTDNYGFNTVATDKTNFANRPKSLFTTNVCDSAQTVANINKNTGFNIKEPACAPLDSDVLSFTLFDKEQNIQTTEANIYIDTEKLPIYGGDSGVWYGFSIGAYLYIDFDYDINVSLKNPIDQTINYGDDATFSTELTIIGDANHGELFWEYSTDAGLTYTQIENSNTPDLHISDSKVYPDGTYFRSAYKAQSNREVEILHSQSATLNFNKSALRYHSNIDGLNLPDEAVLTGSPLMSLPEVSSDGQIFAGWFKDQGLSERASIGEVILADTDFYAAWEEVTKRSLTIAVSDSDGTRISDFEAVIQNLDDHTTVLTQGEEPIELNAHHHYRVILTRVSDDYQIDLSANTQLLEMGSDNLNITFVVLPRTDPSVPEVIVPELPTPETPNPEVPEVITPELPPVEVPETIQPQLPSPEDEFVSLVDLHPIVSGQTQIDEKREVIESTEHPVPTPETYTSLPNTGMDHDSLPLYAFLLMILGSALIVRKHLLENSD